MGESSSSPNSLDLKVSFVDSIADIGETVWSGLAGTDNPFTRYEFLSALETTGCTSRASGWQPHHAIVHQQVNGDAKAVAVMPLYLKTNSYGEYVFDWAWANAYHGHGLDYYPKFVTSAPFTPSYGRRLFVADDQLQRPVIAVVKAAIESEAKALGVSSWHILFPEPSQHELLTEAGLLPRTTCQFHWHNRDYQSFDDFLATMSSRKRKNLRKERQRVSDAGISFRRIAGANIDEVVWQDFYAFYQSTYLMRGMQGYLSLEFFTELSRSMPEQLFLVCAEQEGRSIAAALFFQSSDTLFGRYWGSARDYQFLHFETCYYQGQEYAIEQGLQRFDSGAQGEHKIQRGFEPIITFSNHWIAHPAFGDAIQAFLREEKQQIERYREQAATMLPFRNEDS